MARDPQFSASRRAFLTLPRRTRDVPIRPPRSDEASIAAYCTGCQECAKACPENIISLNANQRPLLKFDAGMCTFCSACAEACPTDAINPAREFIWPWKAEVLDACLSRQGVMCRTCEDVCEPRAIRFKLALGGKSEPLIDTDQCSGCGACAHSCPAQAIRLRQPETQPEKITA
jgi:ferredoxin-type protein NapF